VGLCLGPVANFRPSLLSSEICDLSELISTSGTKKKVCRAQIWTVGSLGGGSLLLLCQEFTDEERFASRCVIMVHHPGFVFPPLRFLPCPAPVHDLQIKLSIDLPHGANS
jgi:hypothetical protein